MTPRQQKRRGKRLRAEALRRFKIETAVQARAPELARRWLDSHPPRGALPVELGEWSRDVTRYDPQYVVDFCGMERRGDGRWRPHAAIVLVPIMDRWVGSVFAPTSKIPGPTQRSIRMRPVQMGMSAGQTLVRWWNWEPTEGAHEGQVESELYRAAGAMRAMLTRVLYLARELGLFRDLVNRPFHETHMAEEGVRFVAEFLEALEQWMGYAKTVYVVPADGPGATEERRA